MTKLSQIEDTFLEEKKTQQQTCFFLMKGMKGQPYLGIIEDYDDKVVKLKGPVYTNPDVIYPKDILLYRAHLISICQIEEGNYYGSRKN